MMISGLRYCCHCCIPLITIATCLFGCEKPRVLMPAPALYATTSADLAGVTLEGRAGPTTEVLYATDRQHVPGRGVDPYPPERERFLQLGVTRVAIGDPEMSWSEVVAQSVDAKRSADLPVRLENVEEFGPLAESVVPFDPIASEPDLGAAGERFAAMINERLDESRRKEILVYVSPFKVDFAEAVRETAEFQHFAGRQGVFIAYSWPSKPGNLSYLNAAENAYRTRRHLRLFLEYLFDNTAAERVHLMTYSAGARVLSGAVHQLTLLSRNMDRDTLAERVRLGHLIFCAPDIDEGAFLEHAVEGLGWMPGRMLIYTNTEDGALKLSRFLYGNPRLGMADLEGLSPATVELLRREDQVTFVSVTNAKDALTGNGHGYFRLSPWVSTDILLTLGLGLTPAERGLVRAEDDALWRFPDDYEQRLLPLGVRWGVGTPAR